MTQNNKYGVQTLKTKPRLNGEEAGMLMIYDLVETYRSMLEGTGGQGLVSSARKHEIVANLMGDENIRRYSELKLAHDYLASVPAAYESYAKTAEVYFCKAHRQLSDLLHAEQENLRDLSRAVHCEIAKNAEPPIPEWRVQNTAERFLVEATDQLNENLTGLVHMTRQCIARETVLGLIGAFIGIPEVKILIFTPDLTTISGINSLIEVIPQSIKRPTEESTQALKTAMKQALCPIDPSSLSPTPQAVRRAADAISYTSLQGGMEGIIAQLATTVK